MGKLFYVYIMASRSLNLYVGVTNSLSRRAIEHRCGKIPGFTKKYRIERLVYFEVFRDVRTAIMGEKQIKAWRREKKLALIESRNPTWQGLAAGWVVPPEKQAADPSGRRVGPRDDSAQRTA